MVEQTGWAQDSLLELAFCDAEAPIRQRRSGKLQNQSRLAQVPLDLPLEVSGSPQEILASGRVLARALADHVTEDDRLFFARSFCRSIIAAFWSSVQGNGSPQIPLRGQFTNHRAFEVDEPAASLAVSMGKAAGRMDVIAASYGIGATYTALLPEETRSRWGVYYTPPTLVHRLLDEATTAGVDWRSCRVLDPACGGGAFLAPVAAKIIAENQHLSTGELFAALSRRLRGLEIDPFAAWASQVFLDAVVLDVCREAGRMLPVVIEVCNSLLRPVTEGEFDLVIGNPPYGRVTLKPEIRKRYARSLYGHANLYGLFTDLAVQLTRQGGVIAYVTPTSFLAGEYFKSLRALLAEDAPPVNIDFVVARKGVFEDVLQETLLATYSRAKRCASASVHFIVPAVGDSLVVEPAGTFSLPCRSSDLWLIPRSADEESLVAALRSFKHRLRDYGYEVSTGPLVWNRHKPQLRRTASARTLPLIWAESVTSSGEFVFRAGKKNHEPYFELRAGDDWLKSDRPCILLQRTTAKEQNRRLIAAELPKGFLSENGAVVIENHLNMIRPINGTPQIPARILTAFLNTEIVDRAFRCISGSVAVSAYELEALPLPPPESLLALRESLRSTGDRRAFEARCAALFEA
jgi:adenine-specific DNA-methyltransferase